MSKPRSQFRCQSCGYLSPGWIGKCPECGEWNSFVEQVTSTASESTERAKGARLHETATQKPLRLDEIRAAESHRIQIGMPEFDRVLGGGLTLGSIVLIGGDPGIGKSTLMMQMVHALLHTRTLYISGEESSAQLKSRASRLGLNHEDLFVLTETNVDAVLDSIRELAPELVIVDSIQTMYRPRIDSAPGSVAQVRESTALLMQMAKMTGIPIFVVGHVTKDGTIAGPKILEHIVDTVLQFEGERTHEYRILRSIKNRFGSTNEIGVFLMSSNGLEEVSNPSEIFLSERREGVSGSAVCAVLEGSRPVLVEIQALVTGSAYGVPQRTVTGYDSRRVAMILAVLEKRLRVRLSQSDVFVNLAGGLRVEEPAVDLAIAMATMSNAADSVLDHEACLIGEVGLGGEVRAVSQVDVRVAEAKKLGFKRIIIPRANLRRLPKQLVSSVVAVENLDEAKKAVL